MESNSRLKAVILQVVDNQLKGNNPPETKQTYDRLIKEGFSKSEAKRLIGCVVFAEIFDVLKNKETFNQGRFVKALNKLPKIPGEEE
ncbi:MAG: hypothetical protein GWP10_06575 [Nitrospiraceae bacterium]|nr:hypothetical protein [Nitrospiraceae bacterium]